MSTYEGERMAAHLDSALAEDLLARFADPATARFDAVLGAAGLAPEVARELRFWQRESVAAVRQYAAQALPAVAAALGAADVEAAAAVARAAAAWQTGPGERPEPGLVVVPTEPAPWADPAATTGPEPGPRTVAARLTRLG